MDLEEVSKIIEELMTSPILSSYQKVRMEIVEEEEMTEVDYINLIVDCLKIEKEFVYNWLSKTISNIIPNLPKDKVEICRYLKENVNMQLLKPQYLSIMPDAILNQAFSKLLSNGNLNK